MILECSFGMNLKQFMTITRGLGLWLEISTICLIIMKNREAVGLIVTGSRFFEIWWIIAISLTLISLVLNILGPIKDKVMPLLKSALIEFLWMVIGGLFFPIPNSFISFGFTPIIVLCFSILSTVEVFLAKKFLDSRNFERSHALRAQKISWAEGMWGIVESSDLKILIWEKVERVTKRMIMGGRKELLEMIKNHPFNLS